MIENWQVRIVDHVYKQEHEIFIFRRTFKGTEILQPNNTAVTILEGETPDVKPTLSLSPEVLQAFADALNNIGIKPQQGFLEGKLEGTERHLADLRTFLKLK